MLKDDYKYEVDDFIRFIEQLNAVFPKESFLKRVFSRRETIDIYVYCNKDRVIEYYYDTTEDKYYMLDAFLKTIFSNEEVFEIDRNFHISTINSINKNYNNLENFYMRKFSHENTRYILNSLVEDTGIKVRLMYNHDDSIRTSIDVFSSVNNKTDALKNICSTIQQITSVIMDAESKKVKMHVTYNDSDNFFNSNIDELLNFMFIPYRFSKVLTANNFTSYIADNEMNTGICIGKNMHPAQKDRYLYISHQVAREHMFIVGRTGAGKSSFFEMIVKSLLESKSKVGLTLFDPKANAVTGVINIVEKLIHDSTYTREEIYSRVKVIDFSNEKALFKINLLDKDMDISILLNFFREIFKSTGPRLEKLITNSVGLLMNDVKEHYISDILKVLRDQSYLYDVMSRADKTQEGKIYVEFFQNCGEIKADEISPVENRITPFIKDLHMQQMFNSGNDLNVREWMENGDIVLFNMANLSPIEMEIIAGYIELKYHIMALKRENNALSHHLFIDECHCVQNDIHGSILATGRSQGLHLVLMTQYLEQMRTDIIRSILENTTTKIVLKQGGGGRQLASLFNTTEEMLKSLDSMTALIKTTVNGKDKFVYTITDPPYRYNELAEVIEYQVVSDEEEKIINLQVSQREKQLNDIARDIMIEQFPKPIIKEERKKVHITNDVFL